MSYNQFIKIAGRFYNLRHITNITFRPHPVPLFTTDEPSKTQVVVTSTHSLDYGTLTEDDAKELHATLEHLSDYPNARDIVDVSDK